MSAIDNTKAPLNTDLESFDASTIDRYNSLATLDRNELDVSFGSFEEAIAATGLTEEQLTYVGSAFRVLDDKSVLVGQPFLIRLARLAQDEKTEQKYVVLYAVTKEGESVIITDGSTGIYAQMVHAINDRYTKQHPTPVEGFLVANGLRVSKYDLTTDNGVQRPAKRGEKVTGEAATYYLA